MALIIPAAALLPTRAPTAAPSSPEPWGLSTWGGRVAYAMIGLAALFDLAAQLVDQ